MNTKKTILFLTGSFLILIGCSKTTTGTCQCTDKKQTVLKIYHDIQCVTTPCFRHELIMPDGEKAIIQNIQEFKIEEVDQKVAYCADIMNPTYPPQIHVTCLETLSKNINDTTCALSESVVIEDKTGLDGCGWVLRRSDGSYYEPINIELYQDKLKTGNVATITFEKATGMGSNCMVGTMIKICSMTITQTVK